MSVQLTIEDLLAGRAPKPRRARKAAPAVGTPAYMAPEQPKRAPKPRLFAPSVPPPSPLALAQIAAWEADVAYRGALPLGERPGYEMRRVQRLGFDGVAYIQARNAWRAGLLGVLGARVEQVRRLDVAVDDAPAWAGVHARADLGAQETAAHVGSLAWYSHTEPSVAWPALSCGVYVSIGLHHATKPPRFHVDAQAEMPCRSVQWNFTHVHATREAAAAEAVAFVVEAERLFAAWRPDVETVTPSRRQHAAWLAHVQASAAWKKADAAELRALADREALGDDLDAIAYGELRAVQARRHEAREAKRRIESPPGCGPERDAYTAWLRAHPWTDFLEGP